MASDDKKSPGADSNGEKASGKPKRPSRVIDLEAREVKSDEKTDSPERDPEADARKGRRTGASSAKTSGQMPRQRTKPSDIKGFVTHLAAGLMGGLVGVLGAGSVLDTSPPEVPAGVQQEIAQNLEEFKQRLDALDATVGEQAKAGAQTGAQDEAVADVKRALGRVEARLEFVETKPDPAAPDLKPLTDRLVQLEETLKTLRASGAQEGASGLAQSAALTGKIDDVSRKLERRSASLGQDIAELKGALAAREPVQGGGNDDAVKALDTRLGALEGKMTELASRPVARVTQLPSRGAGAALVYEGHGAALALAFAGLRRTIDRGEPYGDQMKALEEIAPAGLDLSALAAHAGAGIATDGALLAELAPALNAARVAAAGPAGETFLDHLVSNARSVVRVRRLGPAEGPGADAVLSRMEMYMKAADLPAVLRQVEGLSGAALQSLQPWLDKAKAQSSVRAELAKLERGLMASLKTGRAGKSR